MVRIVGHRGVMAHEPENTLKSFKAAFEMGADAVELDVRISKDKHLVVIHDETVDRTTNGKGFVKNLTLKNLKTFNISSEEKIPTLDEVIKLLLNYRNRYLVIEIKERHIEDHVLNTIRKHKIKDMVVIVSFWHDIIKRIKTKNPDIECGIIFKAMPLNPVQILIDSSADRLHLNYPYIDKKTVDSVRKVGLKVSAWINHWYNAKKLVDMGVYELTTSEPGEVMKYLNGHL